MQLFTCLRVCGYKTLFIPHRWWHDLPQTSHFSGGAHKLGGFCQKQRRPALSFQQSDANLAEVQCGNAALQCKEAGKSGVCFQPSQPHCWDQSGNGPQLPLTLLQAQEDDSTSVGKPSKSHTNEVLGGCAAINYPKPFDL